MLPTPSPSGITGFLTTLSLKPLPNANLCPLPHISLLGVTGFFHHVDQYLLRLSRLFMLQLQK